MNKTFLALAALVLMVSLDKGNLAMAQEQEVKVAPVDFRACTFRDGKDMKDLEKVAEQFRAYANESDINYAAWIMVPQFHFRSGYDVGWLGAWPDSDAFGISMEKWLTTGRPVADAFNKVVDCTKWHEIGMWAPVTAAQSTPEDGILMISQCSLRDGKSHEDAYQAHIRFGNHMRGLGSMANDWLFYPSMGTQPGEFDYYHATTFYRYSDYGAALELYYNGGGYKELAKLSEASSCSQPDVWDVISVRAFDER
jgi:hypothetical protein